MNKFKAVVAGLLLAVTVVSVADAKSRSSSSRSSFSASKSYSVSSKPAASKPSYNGGAFFSNKVDTKPKPALNLNKAPTAVQSKPTLKSLGFTKPTQTVKAPTKVVSTPAKTVVTRKVVSPVRTVQRPKNVTVIQKNYYSGGAYGRSGYNRGYGGGYYGPQYGNSGMGASIAGGALGAFGGMMLYDALTDDKQGAMTAAQTQAIVDNAKQDQRIEDKLDALLSEKERCVLPPNAPLMMNPDYYCGDKK